MRQEERWGGGYEGGKDERKEGRKGREELQSMGRWGTLSQ